MNKKSYKKIFKKILKKSWKKNYTFQKILKKNKPYIVIHCHAALNVEKRNFVGTFSPYLSHKIQRNKCKQRRPR